MTRSRVAAIALLWGAPFLASPTIAHAGAAFYVDAGGALTHIKAPEPFYGADATSVEFGYGLNLGIFTTFTERSPAINLQFGLEDRYTSAANGTGTAGGSFEFMAAYPVLRLQVTRLYLSFGATPFVWRGGTVNDVNTSLTTVSGALSYLGEVGMLSPVTPKFSFGASVSGEWVDANSVLSPSPVYAANFFMRFYFDFGSGETTNSSEFRGWRYPFGRDF